MRNKSKGGKGLRENGKKNGACDIQRKKQGSEGTGEEGTGEEGTGAGRNGAWVGEEQGPEETIKWE
jgi:hypothetical protein